MRVAVAGGTGLVGRLVVEAVTAAGHEPVVVARSAGVDLTTGAGLARALDGVSRVIDASNVVALRRAAAVAFFETATGNLLRAGAAAGVVHHVALSIVGSDRVGLGYYAGKRAQEELVAGSAVPSSVLRTTQFHEFALQFADRRGPFVLAPRMLTRPVAAAEVATALVDLALGDPVGLAPELAGPREEQMVSMVRRLLRARADHRPTLPVRLPGAVGRDLAGGALRPRTPGPRGALTYDAWLAERHPAV